MGNPHAIRTALLERDFFRSLLELGRTDDVESALEGALGLMLELSGAERGYIELRDPAAAPDAPARWWRAHACDAAELATIRETVSRGIIAESVRAGDMIETSSALTDPRFDARESVRRHRIEAVLCAPLGADAVRGVLYLQGRRGGGPFDPEVRHLAELFVVHSQTIVDRAMGQAAPPDPTEGARGKLRADGIIGRSTALARVLDSASLVAPLDTTVLLTGESGTGKSLFARLIAANSPRAGKPVVEINCAALPEHLLENELFGAMPGAHSTASRRLKGKVAAAEGGTLFLDEITEIPLQSQAKLLQLVQDRVYYPLGADQPERCDVRVIAATNGDLARAVASGTFRRDLYYRLNVVPITLPTLSERRDDVPLLARHFCAQACARHGLPRLALSDGAITAAMAATWPGHVRQLANAVEAAVVRAYGDRASVVQARHLFPEQADDDAHASYQEATHRFQRALLNETLEQVHWNVSEAARRLDLARSHVYNLIRAFGLERDGDT